MGVCTPRVFIKVFQLQTCQAPKASYPRIWHWWPWYNGAGDHGILALVTMVYWRWWPWYIGIGDHSIWPKTIGNEYLQDQHMLHAFCEYTQVRIAVSVSRHCTNQMPLQSLIYDCLAKSIVFPFSWCTDKVFEGFAVLPFGQILAKICFFCLFANGFAMTEKKMIVCWKTLHIQSKAPSMHRVRIVTSGNVSLKVYQLNVDICLLLYFWKIAQDFCITMWELKSSQIA